MTSSPELAILRHLSTRTHASAAEIGIACRMRAAEVRTRLVMLQSMRLIVGRPARDADPTAPRRVYIITGEGQRKVRISDVESTIR